MRYETQHEKIKRYGGAKNESTIRVAFQILLNNYCQTRNFLLIPELPYKNQRIIPDGTITIKDALQLDWGYWESKDENDDLDLEIEKKFAKGYPNDNILFEDSTTAILIQSGIEKMRVSMQDVDALDKILKEFIDYQRPEVAEFYQAITKFKEDLPTLINTLRERIDEALTSSPTPLLTGDKKTSPLTPLLPGEGSKEKKKTKTTPPSPLEEGGRGGEGKFHQKIIEFLNLCQNSINPNITIEDVREMMIQHILTEDIFLTIFDEAQFHRDNNIARELTDLIDSFLKGGERKKLLSSIQHYYKAIKSKASQINNHHEKQKFLKAIYENFYKAYNPLSADRLGIVYTPNEIVRFMIESTDFLLHKHFNKLLIDKDVEILDPATGTGTFITELIEYLPINSQNCDALRYKYQHEIHCNEVAILPYYIANLNIEYTYQQKTGEYQEFNNICFVDTLDHTSFEGKQMDLFAMSLENTARIKRQNEKKISVIIGNPPYNANQQNENDNNKNREYPAIDKRRKATYVKESTAQKTKVYDMYARFFRWATDRLNDNGIIAFITNSSFIDAKTFDGFRKLINEEFSEVYIIDLDGDVRKNPKISGTTHNVFGIQTGVAISFFIKKNKSSETPCKIFYTCRPDDELAIDKLNFLALNKLDEIDFQHITPDKNNNWINLADDNDFDRLIPVANKETKLGKSKNEETAIFKLFSNGVNTARDEWVFDYNVNHLLEKIQYFINKYNLIVNQSDNRKIDDILDDSIKWSADLKKSLLRKTIVNFNDEKVVKYNYRPFVKNYYYSEQLLSDRLTSNHYDFFGVKLNNDNLLIIINNPNSSKNISILSCKNLADFHLVGDSQCLPLYTYDKEGKREENITDWALAKFKEYYCRGLTPLNPTSPENQNITKEDIFYYVYAVLHNPKYREKYELNLKREFPRIPFYDNFCQWVNWGKKLMNLHLNYEEIEHYKLNIINVGANGRSPLPEGTEKSIKPKLKADKIKHQIIIDEVTILTEIPPLAWEYKLGNRSALEWILDQYKEKKPKDKTIAERFNNYRFADYKEKVIDLLMRVTTVSVETMKIIKEMENLGLGKKSAL